MKSLIIIYANLFQVAFPGFNYFLIFKQFQGGANFSAEFGLENELSSGV